jgi:RNA polymerase sigma-70 factor, ECF subfamily
MRSHRKPMKYEMQTTRPNLYTDASVHQSAILELEEVLSVRWPSFHRCAFRVLGNAADAEDAVQEALCAAYKHIGQFKGQAQMSTWLTTIVRNSALMQLRKRSRHTHLSLDEITGEEQQHFVGERLADGRPSPEDECRNFELCERVQKHVARLSPTLRRAFQLRVINGLSIFETAQLLRLPPGTVKAQLARARAKIARHLRPAGAPRSRRPQRRLHR